MNYRLSGQYRVSFTAHAPMHTFRGHSREGIEAEMDIDFETLTLTGASARADVRKFTTGDEERDQAMQVYMDPEANPRAAVEITRVERFLKTGDDRYRIDCLVVLAFMGIRRQMPVSFSLFRGDGTFSVQVALKWSFKAYGLKAPQLLFLKVRDIVDIEGEGLFVLAQDG